MIGVLLRSAVLGQGWRLVQGRLSVVQIERAGIVRSGLAQRNSGDG